MRKYCNVKSMKYTNNFSFHCGPNDLLSIYGSGSEAFNESMYTVPD